MTDHRDEKDANRRRPRRRPWLPNLAEQVAPRIQWRRRPKHHHNYQRVGYGGAGWSLYACPCGKTEIDA